MTKLEVEIHDDVIEICSKIKSIEDTGIEVTIPKGSVLFDSTVNIKLLKKFTQKEGKILTVITEDEQGRSMLEMTEEGATPPAIPYEEHEPKVTLLSKLKTLKTASPFKRVNLNMGILPVILVLLLILGSVGGYFLLQKVHKASAKIIVEAQPLTRSVKVSVKKDSISNYKDNVLKGISLQETIENTQTIETTGEKVIGNTSKGEITIYNKTADEKKFEEGEVLIFEEEDKEYKYKLSKDVTVPARIDDPVDPTKMMPGEETANIEALEIGNEYNINEDETLEFDDYKKSDYVAKTKDDLEGGRKETKQAVSAEDLETLKTELLETNTKGMQESLDKSSGKENEYIEGSEYLTVLEEKFNKEEGEETEEVSLNQTITAEGLAYSQKDLEKLLNEILKDLIPEGYEISEKDNDIKVEILGNSTDSILNSTQADLQATIKTYIVPKIDEDTLKDDLKGKTLSEAQKVLGGIRNVKTYELLMSPNLPFIRKLPKDIEKISINIEKD